MNWVGFEECWKETNYQYRGQKPKSTQITPSSCWKKKSRRQCRRTHTKTSTEKQHFKQLIRETASISVVMMLAFSCSFLAIKHMSISETPKPSKPKVLNLSEGPIKTDRQPVSPLHYEQGLIYNNLYKTEAFADSLEKADQTNTQMTRLTARWKTYLKKMSQVSDSKQ